MKKARNLYDKICSFDNLLLAYKKASKGRKSSPAVIDFAFNLENELLKLLQELETKSYRPGDYRSFHIHDPKKRMISAAPFRDRVVHHALCNIIEPVLDKRLIFDTYANRKGKGTHEAIRRCQKYMRQFDFVLKSDIKKYFPSIDLGILKEQLRRVIGCRDTLCLIEIIIDNSNAQETQFDYFPGDNLFTPSQRRKGLPLGNLTSQYFANFYLNSFDHFIKETLCAEGYVRYVDDFVIFAADKQTLIRYKRAIEDYLGSHLRLIIHPQKSQSRPCSKGVTFLGQRIFRTHRLLEKENVRRFWQRYKQNIKELQKGKIGFEDIEISLNSWKGHVSQANTYHLVNKIKQHIRVEGWTLLEKRTGSWMFLCGYWE